MPVPKKARVYTAADTGAGRGRELHAEKAGASEGAEIAALVSWLRSQSTEGQLVHVHRLPGRPPRTKPLQYMAQVLPNRHSPFPSHLIILK